MINCLIVDDEPLARQRLRQLLEDHPDCRIVGECGDGLEAVQAIEAAPPDLVFLDIQMPVLDGFGVIEAVGAARMPATLFVTAYDQYALQAFEVHAVDFLLKPIGRDRFQAAMDRARAWRQGPTRPSLAPLVARAVAGRAFMAYRSDRALAAAILPNRRGSSTIGGKKSTVCTRARPGPTRKRPASSLPSKPARTPG